MRTLISTPPFPDHDPEAPYQPPYRTRRAWPADWIGPTTPVTPPTVIAYRCRWALPAARGIRIHVSADERYDLWLDSEPIGAGPERCSPERWAFETYDLELAAGDHELFARVWTLGDDAPWPQTSIAHGFLCAAEAPDDRHLLTTGQAPWRWRRLAGWSTITTPGVLGAGGGGGFHYRAASADSSWQDVAIGANATGPGLTYCRQRRHLLRPALLPDQAETPIDGLRVRHADHLPVADAKLTGTEHRTAIADAWQRLVDQDQPLRIPAGETQRVVIDLASYQCWRPQLQAAGHGGCIDLVYAEAAFDDDAGAPTAKSARDTIDGRSLVGLTDRFTTATVADRFRPLWWRAGRFVLLVARAGSGDLVVERFTATATTYPLAIAARWAPSADDGLWQACLRTLRCCLHETYMDCPYYEQLQYIGDTRIQALCTYALSADDRPQRAALRHIEASRHNPSGLPTSNHPSTGGQLIPPFCLLGIGMLHDFLLWRGDRAELRPLLPGMRATLERFLLARDDAGFPRSLPGWNYLDAEGPGMLDGEVPGGEAGGRSTALAWMLVIALDQAGDLEAAAGEAECAARWRRHAEEIASLLIARCWQPAAACFGATPDDPTDLPHVQILAALSPRLPRHLRDPLVARTLARAEELRCGIMFSHYLFELATAHGRFDAVRPLWQRWRDALAQGFTTFPEHWGETRSDCHAWSAHPLYHYITGVAGIRPAAPGFRRVRIAPQPAPGEAIAVSVPHPRGDIAIELHQDGTSLRCHIDTPVPGTLHWRGATHRLESGPQDFGLPPPA